MTGSQIFLSYSRADSDFALKLGADLRKAGIDIWIDQFDIPPSVPWDEEIQKGLDESTGLLVVLSSKSVESDNVLNEINYALETKKQVWPILIETAIKKPFNINRLQHIDFTMSYENAFELLLSSLRSGHTPVRASITTDRRKPLKLLIAGIIFLFALLGFLAYRGIIFSANRHDENILVNEKPSVSPEMIDGSWTSEIITNQFDPADRYHIIFNLKARDSLLAGNMELKATPDGKGYHVKRPFREGKIKGQNISFYTMEESYRGGENISFKNFYIGTVNADSIIFTWTSDRPWDFPEQKFVARR